VSKVTTFFGGDHALKTNVHGGVDRAAAGGRHHHQRGVDRPEPRPFVTPGKSSTVGWVAGAGFDYHVKANVAVFGAVEGTMMTDQSPHRCRQRRRPRRVLTTRHGLCHRGGRRS